jgi:DNA transposition AAA+ family ATPase
MLTSRVDICIDQHLHPETRVHRGPQTNHVELLVIDEADRLSSIALEHLRDRFDRQHLGLLLIGMPGIENASPPTPSSTAASGSPTNTGH